MFVLYHKGFGKYMSMSDDKRTLSTERTIRTATAFPDVLSEGFEKWIASAGMDGEIVLHYVEGVSVASEKWLELANHAKYSVVKKFQSDIETLALYMQQI